MWLLIIGAGVFIAAGLYWLFDRKNGEIEEMRYQIKRVSTRNLTLVIENKKLKEQVAKMEFVFDETKTKFTLRK